MAIKKESLAALLVKLAVFDTKENAVAAIEATEEKDVSIPDSTKVYSESEFATVAKNLKNEGINAGKEIAIKDLKEKAGLDFEGKSPEKLLEEYKKSVLSEANVSVDEKVKAKEKTITDLKAALQKVEEEKTTAIQKATLIERKARLKSMLPKDRDDRFTDDQYLTLLEAELAIEQDGDKEVVKHKGNVMQDDKFNPLAPDQAIASIFQTNKWVKQEGAPPFVS